MTKSQCLFKVWYKYEEDLLPSHIDTQLSALLASRAGKDGDHDQWLYGNWSSGWSIIPPSWSMIIREVIIRMINYFSTMINGHKGGDHQDDQLFLHDDLKMIMIIMMHHRWWTVGHFKLAAMIRCKYATFTFTHSKFSWKRALTDS